MGTKIPREGRLLIAPAGSRRRRPPRDIRAWGRAALKVAVVAPFLTRVYEGG